MTLRLRLILGFAGMILAVQTFAQTSQNLGTVATNPGPNRMAVPGPNPVPQNQIGTDSLGLAYTNTMCGLNFVQVSQKLGQRFSPPGPMQPTPMTVPPIPCANNANIIKAFLWTETSGNGAPITATITNPNNVTQNFPMTLVGSGPDKCWGYTGTYTYRADVTTIIAGAGPYTITGLPTNPPTPGNDVDGATMIIIYKDPNATYQGTIDIWDGCNTKLGGNAHDTLTGINVCGPTQNAVAFEIVADLQNIAPGAFLTVNNSAPFHLPTEDWWNWIQQPTTVPTGPLFGQYGCNTSGDCFDLLLMGLYYQTTTCATCVPAVNNLNTTTASTGSSCAVPTGTASVTASGGSGPYTYSWSSVPVQTTDTAVNLTPGWYHVSVIDATGCNVRLDSVLVPGHGNLSATSTSTNVKCNGGHTGEAIVTVQSGMAPYTYSWTNGVSTTDTAANLPAGTYTVNVTDAAGCTFSTTFNVRQPPLVPLSVVANNDTAICTGKSVSLNAVASGGDGGTYTYSWSNGAGTLPHSVVSPTITTNYIITVKDSCGTPPATDTVMVAVNPLPTVNFTPNITEGCAPLCVSYTNNTVATASCFWNFGDSQTSTSTTSPLTHCYTSSGQYSVSLKVTNTNGCIDSLSLVNIIKVYQMPVAAFSYNPQPTTLDNPNISFTDQSQYGDTCTWILGDGHTVVIPGCGNLEHTYGDTGNYIVYEIVKTNHGCTDTISHDVIISPYTIFYIPNAFTPNNDGINDVFKPSGLYVNQYELLIFDRWGNQIFKSNDINVGWDGKVQGSNMPCMVDTYVYTVKYHDYFDKEHKYIGSVNLIH